MTALLQVDGIAMAFGGIKAVDQFSFHVDEGEIVGLIGPNGAGKTTVFNVLTGIYQAQQGSIHFDGKPLLGLSPQAIVRAGISRTFQNIRLFRQMKVIENVLVGKHTKTRYRLIDSTLRRKNFQEEEALHLAEVLQILERLGMADKRDAFVSDLPYGDQRKVEIARAIATGAKLILLDEPAAGMNPQESEELLRFIRQLRDMGYTILLIEHDMRVVMNVSDRVLVLDQGQCIAEGLPEKVANDEQVITAYLGGILHA